MIRDNAGEKAWTMHVRGYTVGEIASRLHVEEEFVREQIVASWRRDREDFNRMMKGEVDD